MPDARRTTGGFKYCPHCNEVRETRVCEELNKNVRIGDLQAKRRRVICGLDRKGQGGYGRKWWTVEVVESELKQALCLSD